MKVQPISINNPEYLLDQLLLLKNQGFVFRGLSQLKYDLQPAAFRKDKIDKRACNFRKKVEINNWFNSPEVDECVYWQAYPLPPHQIIGIPRLNEWLAWLFQYNYDRHKYSEEHWDKVSEEEKEFIKRNGRNKEYWLLKESFLSFFSFYFESLRYILLPGQIIHQPFPKEITALDETYPQHYGGDTAALDWTYNPFISIFFALNLNNHPSSDVSNEFSICALKVLEPKYIHMQERSLLVHNERAEAQEGTFSYFVNPCVYFIENGTLPSIEDYYFIGAQKTFELRRFNFKISPQHIDYLRSLLIKNNITKEALKLVD